jgi:hypothetical protein
MRPADCLSSVDGASIGRSDRMSRQDFLAAAARFSELARRSADNEAAADFNELARAMMELASATA